MISNRSIRMFRKEVILLFLYTVLFAIPTVAQTVKVVGIGEGKTREDAVHMALRESLERTYNSFLSSSTLFSDDEIVSDEISVITRGNIVKYSILYDRIDSISKMHNAMVEAVVSLQKFKEYAISHGASIELDGKSLAQSIVANERMRKFNEENELKAVKQLVKDFVREGQSVQIYDYNINVELPQKASSDNRYKIRLTIDGYENDNYYVVVYNLYKAIMGISSKEGPNECYLGSFFGLDYLKLFILDYWISYYRDGNENKPIQHEDDKANRNGYLPHKKYSGSYLTCPLCGKKKFEDWNDAHRTGVGICHNKNCGFVISVRDWENTQRLFSGLKANLWNSESTEWLRAYFDGGGGTYAGLIWKRKFKVVDNNNKVYATKIVYPRRMFEPNVYHEVLELNLTYDELSNVTGFSVEPIRGIPLKEK